MTPTIKQQLNHKSIRQFTSQELTATEVNLLVNVAQHAPTSNFRQAYSIISITDEKLKKELEEKNKHIEKLIDNEKSMQNLLDQQQRLALQDKKLLEEYKSEINELKALKMPREDMKDGSSIRGEVQEEIERLKAQLKLSEEERNKAKEKDPVKTESKKWWQL